jgi:hypothetical protein
MFRKNPKNANFSPEKQTANDVFYPEAHLRQAFGGQW